MGEERFYLISFHASPKILRNNFDEVDGATESAAPPFILPWIDIGMDRYMDRYTVHRN